MEKKSGSKSSTPQSRVVRTGAKTSRGRKISPAERTVRTTLAIVGKVVLTIFLVLTITCCIVGTAMTIYVMEFIDSESTIDLNALKLNFNSTIYALDENGEYQAVQSLRKDQNRIWVDLKDIPQHVQDAFVYSEDERFMQHNGVDFKRTIAAFVNEALRMIGVDADKFGGSTITQQLLKNINGDFYDRSIDKKIQEIIQAMNLERHYTKPQILEMYLNYVGLGNAVSGVQAGAKYYFGKSVSELSYAEAASLAATTKSPDNYNPKTNPEENKKRRVQPALEKMLEFGTITQAEYDEAVKEDITVVGSMVTTTKKVQSYYDDAVIEAVIADLMETYNYTKEYADELLHTAGYQVYSNREIRTQSILEKYFENPETFAVPELGDKEPPQASMVIMDLNGNIRALVGGMGEKKESRGFNRATMSNRPAGSTIKPLGVYSLAFQNNLVNWSTVMVDEAVTTTIDSKTGAERGYPQNYDWKYGGPISIIEAIKVSKNTIPFKLCQTLSPRVSFDFVQKELGLYSLNDPNNVNEASLALGDGGVYLTELTAAYQIFGNGGYFTEPALYSKVTDAQGKVVLDTTKRAKKQVLSPDTAYVMNKALWRVVNERPGSGTAGKLANFETVGKTGTSNDRKDLVFMGVTPYYVAGIRYGYDDNNIIIPGKSSFQIPVWKTIMTEVHEGLNPANFELDSTGVSEMEYCLESGLLATVDCPSKTMGFYKDSFIPSTCSIHGITVGENPWFPGASSGETSENGDGATTSPDGEIVIP